MVQCALGQAHHLGADGNAALVQRLDGHFVSLAHLTQHVGCGHAAIVENQLASGGRADAQLVLLLSDPKAGEIALDQESR